MSRLHRLNIEIFTKCSFIVFPSYNFRIYNNFQILEWGHLSKDTGIDRYEYPLPLLQQVLRMYHQDDNNRGDFAKLIQSSRFRFFILFPKEHIISIWQYSIQVCKILQMRGRQHSQGEVQCPSRWRRGWLLGAQSGSSKARSEASQEQPPPLAEARRGKI